MQNFIKTIINAVQTWTKAEIKKNRTHWTEEEVLLVNNLTKTQYENGNFPPCDFIVGEKYKVIFNGKTYDNLICYRDGDFDIIAAPDKGQPFYINDDGGNALFIEADGDWIISIYGPIIHKLDSKYLNLPNNLATTDDVEEAMYIVANSKMNKSNPVGTGSFSMNSYASGTNAIAIGYDTNASGEYSYAEGYKTNASKDYRPSVVEVPDNFNNDTRGHCSHAEGGGTVASGIYAHAEGRSTAAWGASSHAEGKHTIASGVYSHAEGVETTASGQGSHAEGNDTTASGFYCHAEGWMTTASGTHSHAEGEYTTASSSNSHAEGRYTTAQRKSQHVQGEYNISDTEGTEYTKGRYAHIVGNGTSDTDRSNAHTLDWNGVGWFQGGLQVGGNAQDDGAKNVMLEGDAYDYFILNDAITGAPYKIEIRNGNLVSSLMASLDDFTYTTNEDGTNIITGWNETYLGKSSTEMIVPNDGSIII